MKPEYHVARTQWLQAIEGAWSRKPLLWIAGVRRVGKTSLCLSIPGIELFDCELPRVRRSMEDPEAFLDGVRGKRIALDEIHRLPNPSELLKIAADHYPDVRILATGSSTLGATAKFRDTLAGRKETLWLTPMTSADLRDFGGGNLPHRLLRGGLPPFFLAGDDPERDFQEWMDAYWAKDIQEMFRLERRTAFLAFVEMLLAQSGGIFEATRFASACGVSHTTIRNYLGALEATFVAHVVRPYSTRRSVEIVAAPKVYGFDTGFVCHERGWTSLRGEDLGALWEHYVLNEMHGRLQQRRPIRYWRDKQGREVDFILVPRGKPPVAIECKWSAAAFDPASLLAFRRLYPSGRNLVVAHDVDRPFERTVGPVRVRYVGLEGMLDGISG
ncbi:MAG: ATP-binding protein [Planctomycetes bacterium]|nr:ATP-binding protein [Planctomycetota bacterium]